MSNGGSGALTVEGDSKLVSDGGEDFVDDVVGSGDGARHCYMMIWNEGRWVGGLLKEKRRLALGFLYLTRGGLDLKIFFARII